MLRVDAGEALHFSTDLMRPAMLRACCLASYPTRSCLYIVNAAEFVRLKISRMTFLTPVNTKSDMWAWVFYLFRMVTIHSWCSLKKKRRLKTSLLISYQIILAFEAILQHRLFSAARDVFLRSGTCFLFQTCVSTL